MVFLARKATINITNVEANAHLNTILSREDFIRYYESTNQAYNLYYDKFIKTQLKIRSINLIITD